MATGDDEAKRLNNIKQQSEILNDLNRLIALGTVDIKIQRPLLPAPGLDAPDGWKWLPWVDIASYNEQDGYVDNFTLAKAIYTLIDYLQIQVTYNNVDTMIRLRIYSVPTDVEGAHLLAQLPRGPQAATKISSCFSILLTYLDCSPARWSGDLQNNDNDNDAEYKIYNGQKTTGPSLFEMYNTISFPNPKLNKDLDYVGRLLVDEALSGDPPGIKTDLYKYQMETIASMIGRELAPGKYCMPNIQRMISPRRHHHHYYYSWTASRTKMTKNNRPVCEFHTFLYPPMFDNIPGGILAEDMGLGKTLICLALICITRDQISRVPYQYQVMNGLGKATNNRRVCSSLMCLCANTVRLSGIPWRDYADQLGRQSVQEIKKSSYYYIASHKILLSSTTLIVCPDTLVEQWQDEINKHLEPGYLSVLCISNSKVPVPSPNELIQYDVVIFSLSKFSLLGQDSSLMGVHWKRLIIDEGHSMGSHSTRAVILAGEMAVERRWAVTGTPTRGLIGGLEFNNNLQEEISTPPPTMKKRNNTELNDLKKLKGLVCDFLKLRPWYSQEAPIVEEEQEQKQDGREQRSTRRRSRNLPIEKNENGYHLWRRIIEIPYTKLNYSRNIEGLLNQIMIRHQFKDIFKEIKLPPLYHKVVLIEPSFYNKISLNLFSAVIASNAVTSERTDQDYLFHASNRAFLKRLVYNLQNATFHWSGFSRCDVEALVEIGLYHLKRDNNNHHHHFNQSDTQLLHKAVEAGQAALKSDCWNAFAENHEMAYFIQDLPNTLASTWLGLSPPIKHDKKTCYWVFSGPQLLKAQNYIKRNGYNDDDNQLEAGIIAATQQEQQQDSVKNKNKSISPRILSKDRWSEESQHQHHKPGHTTGGNASNGGGGGISQNSRLTNIKLSATASGKLTYLINKLIEIINSSNEKVIIFYQHPDTAFYIAESLELIGLNHLIYATSLPPSQRANYLVKFNNSKQQNDDGGERIIIMDVNLASHGLDLSSASRIFFVNLIWQPNIEAQAKKRAHRIGQILPVYVETLILANTIEEALYNRRQGLVDNVERSFFNDNKDLTDDDGMQSIISAAQFILPSSSSSSSCGGGDMIDSCLDTPHQLFPSSSSPYDSFTSSITTTTSTATDILHTESISSRATTPPESPRLIKRVKFA